MIQAKAEDRANLESINNIYDEQPEPSSISKESMVLKLFLFNMLKSVNVNGKSNPGFRW
jgi:HAE1 family hydrophobic/amphiphilic exporter-1